MPARTTVVRRRRGRRVAAAVLLVLLAVAGVAAILLARGTYDTYPRTALIDAEFHPKPGAPAWTRPCQGAQPSGGEHSCVRVRGRVIWIQGRDPDGDGDRHLIVMARLHPRIVEVSAELGAGGLPSLGTRVDATGWLQTGGSGHREIDTKRLVWGGRTAGSPGA
jgi:hypothetical protein